MYRCLPGKVQGSRTNVSLLDALEGEAVGAADGAGKDAIRAPVAVVCIAVEVRRPPVVIVEPVASPVHDVAALAVPSWDPLSRASGPFVHVQLVRLRR